MWHIVVPFLFRWADRVVFAIPYLITNSDAAFAQTRAGLVTQSVEGDINISNAEGISTSFNILSYFTCRL